MPDAPVIVWFRQDLRLYDNPALAEAIETGRPVIPLYVDTSDEEGAWAPGGAAKVWLHHALADLAKQIEAAGSRLILRQGEAAHHLGDLLSKTGAAAVYWNRRYEPDAIDRDGKLKESLKADGIDARSFNAALINEPHAIENKSGEPFKVFTPYYKHCRERNVDDPVDVDLKALKAPESWPQGKELDSLNLLPRRDWNEGIEAAWEISREGGTKRMKRFLKDAVRDYGNDRDRPDRDGTSRLSPYLHWGMIGPREILSASKDVDAGRTKGGQKFIAEVYWREFAHHVLYHFPRTPTEPLYDRFEQFPWSPSDEFQRAWRKGLTGYPIVDAGMRQLWKTGWIHNRVRMNVGSLFVKHLLQPWQDGAEWFWDCLVDADLASNTLGWQWSAGCGADGAPYFRVFNPIIQGRKFDPEGSYIREYVPEIAALPDKYIHAPWEAPEEVQRDTGVEIGETYPKPLVEHQAGRQRALRAFDELKERTA